MDIKIAPIPISRRGPRRQQETQDILDLILKSKAGESVKLKREGRCAARNTVSHVQHLLRKQGVKVSSHIEHDGTVYIWKVENEPNER